MRTNSPGLRAVSAGVWIASGFWVSSGIGLDKLNASRGRVVGLRRAVALCAIPHPLQKAQRVRHPGLGSPRENVARGHPDLQAQEIGGTRRLWLKGSSGVLGVSLVAGPSTALRSAQDDKFVGVRAKNGRKQVPRLRSE